MRTALKAIVAGVSLTASVSALSVPMFSSFDGEVRSGFTAFSPAGVTGSDNVTLFDSSVVPSTLSWGVPAGSGQSSLEVVSEAPPISLITNGGFSPSGTLTHNNFPVFPPTLQAATLQTEIQLTPTGFPALPVDSLSLAIDFVETVNEGGAGGACAGGGFDGDAGVNVNGCADIFVVDVQGAGFNAAGQIVRQLGDLGDSGYLYQAIIAISGAGPLSPQACAAAGASAGCVGFLTTEEQSNFASTSIAIEARAKPVPAPAPILGLGLGLVLMARMRRNRA